MNRPLTAGQLLNNSLQGPAARRALDPHRDYRWSTYLQMIAPQGRWKIANAIIGTSHWNGVVEEYPNFDRWEEIANDLIDDGNLPPLKVAELQAALNAIFAMRQLRENEYEAD